MCRLVVVLSAGTGAPSHLIVDTSGYGGEVGVVGVDPRHRQASKGAWRLLALSMIMQPLDKTVCGLVLRDNHKDTSQTRIESKTRGGEGRGEEGEGGKTTLQRIS